MIRKAFVMSVHAGFEAESRIAETDVCKRWWAHMKDLMRSHPDNSPVAAGLREVFHLA